MADQNLGAIQTDLLSSNSHIDGLKQHIACCTGFISRVVGPIPK
jgi:hypothetical protein